MATPVVGPAAAPDAGQLHPALNVFLAPSETMRSLARRPRFFVALLIATVIGAAITSLALQRGVIEQFMRHKMESNPRMEQLPADQRERVIEQSLKFSSYGYVGVAVVGPTVGLLLVSGVFLLLTKVVGGKSASYRQMIAVVAQGWLPHSLANLVAIPILLAKDPESVDFQNMLPMANLSVLFSPTEQHKQYLLGSSIDLFSFWVIWLFAIGLSELTGKSKAAVLPVILVPWALFVCFKVVTG